MIRRGEIGDGLEIDPSGCMRDQFAREQIDPRISLEPPLRQLWQFEVILSGQVLADITHLVLDDVMVVTEPLFCADRRFVRTSGARKEEICLVQSSAALFQLRKQWMRAAGIIRDAVGGGDPGRVRLELARGEDSWGRKLNRQISDRHVQAL